MQDNQDRNLADSRVRLLSTRPVATLVVLGCGITLGCILLLVAVSFVLTSGDGPRAINNDFRVFWAAGQMALNGDFLGVFDTDRLAAIHDVMPEFWMPWLYPPGFLFLIAPLGAVSFATGFAIISVLSVACLALAVRPFAAGSWVAWLAFSLAPAYLPMLIQGQNGLVWIAGLVAALAALRAERWILAGVIFGLLTLKPQYGVLIPIALLAAGLWRTFLSASATAVVLAAVPTFWTGVEYWVLFIQRMGEYRDTISELIPELDMAASAFSFFVQLGLDPSIAILCHSAVALAVAISLFFIWRARQVCFDTKAASLLIGCFMASPVVWYNEAAFMALVGLFLLRAGVLGRTPVQLLLLAVLWFGAGLQAMAFYVGLGDHHFQWAFVTTPVMLLCLALCLRQLGSNRSDKAEPAQDR
jgi:hypothetical protein